MIQRYDTTQQKRVDASIIRRYDGSQWVDVQFVRRYDSNTGSWVDVLAKEYEFYLISYSTKVDYVANGSTATVYLHGAGEHCKIGVSYLDSSSVSIENPVLKGLVTSSDYDAGAHMGNVNITDRYIGPVNSKTEFIYNGTELEVSFDWKAKVIEIVVRCLDRDYAAIQLSNFTLNGVPVKFV